MFCGSTQTSALGSTDVSTQKRKGTGKRKEKEKRRKKKKELTTLAISHIYQQDGNTIQSHKPHELDKDVGGFI